MGSNVYTMIYLDATLKDGVREITYDQFMELRNSGDEYVLIDVLSRDSFAQGHIAGAINIPLEFISRKAADIISVDSKVVVYCGGFQCGVSSKAAKELIRMGYTVIDFKGGLQEWQEKGNQLVTR